MNKYREALLASIRKQLNAWLELGRDDVSRDDLYRFLHTVRGTSGTIGLAAISNTTARLMDDLEQSGRKSWTTGQLRTFFSDLIRAVYALGQQETTVQGGADGTGSFRFDQDEQPAVLVLDDDDAFLLYMKEELGKRGYRVIATTNPSLAMDYVRECNPQCVVLDLFMDHTAGVEFMLALRDKMKRRFIPTTVVGVEDTTANRIQAFRLGADDFVAKPFEMAELAARLERQLVRKRLFDRLLRTGGFRPNSNIGFCESND